MSVSSTVDNHVKELKSQYKLTDFEALQIAVKMAEIESYEEANVLGREKGIPALEAIAICLGMSSQFSVTITDAISSLGDAVGRVAESISEKES